MSRPTVHTATRVLRVLMPGKAPKIPVSVRARACAAPVMRRFASTRRAMSSGSGTHTRAGFALDIDGCVWRGGDLIPGSRDAVGHLIDQQFPVVFMTNGGGKTEVEAAQVRRALPACLSNPGLRTRCPELYFHTGLLSSLRRHAPLRGTPRCRIPDVVHVVAAGAREDAGYADFSGAGGAVAFADAVAGGEA